MLVTDIEISNYHYCRRSARHLANVCVTLRTQIVTLFCQLDLPADEAPATRASAFVGEALRQLRRMPELRSGQRALEFADGLEPRQTA